MECFCCVDTIFRTFVTNSIFRKMFASYFYTKFIFFIRSHFLPHTIQLYYINNGVNDFYSFIGNPKYPINLIKSFPQQRLSCIILFLNPYMYLHMFCLVAFLQIVEDIMTIPPVYFCLKLSFRTQFLQSYQHVHPNPNYVPHQTSH